MKYSLDIIKSNLEKLDEVRKCFPDIIDKYYEITFEENRFNPPLRSPSFEKELKNMEQKNLLKLKASNLRLSDYINFIDWISSLKTDIIHDEIIKFKDLKEVMLANCIDSTVVEIIKKKTHKGLVSLILSDEYQLLTGRRSYKSYSRKHNRRHLSKNLQACEPMIFNYLIQNGVELDNDDFLYSTFYYFRYKFPDFEKTAAKELDLTNTIISSISKIIEDTKIDLKKLNYNILERDLKSIIQKEMLKVSKDEKLRCIEGKDEYLTFGKLYDVLDYRISSDGTLSVRVVDDMNNNHFSYNYCLFERVTKLRDDKINDILN